MNMDIAGYIFDPFEYRFMIRALMVSVIVSVVCPVVGIFVITRGYGFMGDALAHSVFPGMVAAIIAGLSPWFGAIPTAVVFAVFVGYIVKHTGLRSDAAIAIMFATMFALGVIMISAFSSRVTVDLEALLLGQILGVSTGDIWVAMAATVFVLAIIAGLYKEIVFVSFDNVGAEVAGIGTARIDYVLLATIGVVVVVTVQAVGVILVLAMLVAPSASAILVVRRRSAIMLLGIVFALTASVSGLYVSYYVNLPAGPSMALISGVIFGVLALIRRRVAPSIAATTQPSLW